TPPTPPRSPPFPYTTLFRSHELLEDGVLAQESAAMLTEGQRERRLVFGKRPLCVSLRPNLISEWQYAEVNAAAETIYAALGRLEIGRAHVELQSRGHLVCRL